MEVNGIVYKTKAFVATKLTTDFEEPSFGVIGEIYVVGSSIYFYVQEMETMEYNEHYCVYVICTTQHFELVNLDSIKSYLPLSSHKLAAFPGSLCTIPKFKIV